MTAQDIHDEASRIVDKVCGTMYGVEEPIRLTLVGLFTKGHVLLEGNPGLGKTALVKALSDAARLHWGRIQFTPDLMPSDITGTEIPRGGEFVFKEGPVFKTLLLADEINRASPKTQSAMLEAMAERQVTVLGRTYPLPAFFTVFATQNPIDHEGVYPLPEAQSDRFMFKIYLHPPDLQALARIVDKDAGAPRAQKERVEVSDEEDKGIQDRLKGYYEQIRNAWANPVLETHVQMMFLASNLKTPALHAKLEGLEKDRKPILAAKQLNWIKENKDLFQFGLGPRAATAITLAAKAWMMMFPDYSHERAEAADLAHVALPVLRHRLKPVYDWEDKIKDPDIAKVKDLDQQQKNDWLLTRFVLSTAPMQDRYAEVLAGHLLKPHG